VAQVTLDLKFTLELVCDLCVNQLFFVHDFERDDEAGLLFSRKVYCAKLALAKSFSDFKVIDGPLFWDDCRLRYR
jgi:hypothetical protein